MLAIRSDFADIFQVRAKQLLPRGKWKQRKDNALTTEYQNKSFRRGIITAPDGASSPPTTPMVVSSLMSPHSRRSVATPALTSLPWLMGKFLNLNTRVLQLM